MSRSYTVIIVTLKDIQGTSASRSLDTFLIGLEEGEEVEGEGDTMVEKETMGAYFLLKIRPTTPQLAKATMMSLVLDKQPTMANNPLYQFFLLNKWNSSCNCLEDLHKIRAAQVEESANSSDKHKIIHRIKYLKRCYS